MMRFRLRGFLPGLVFLACGTVLGGSALADSLYGAMEKAYTTNPTLQGARAGQRATDELVPQALSGWRPTVTVNGGLVRDYTEFSDGAKISDTGRSEVEISLRQPLFRGFRTIERTKAAEARVDAGRQNLLASEQSVLFNVVQAYMNVYSGRQLVALQKQNVAVLSGQLRAANERFNVGEITRTDVAQARASLAQAQASLTNVEATLAGDVAKYLQIVGNEPGKLVYPKINKLPKTLKSALATAGETSPNILAAAFVEVASQHDIEVERAALLPQASLEASAFKQQNFENNSLSRQGASVAARVSIPLYEGGEVYSRVRQAKQLASQKRIEVIEVARAIRQAVAAAWNAYVALGDIIRAAKSQVAASNLALDGVQQEYQAGTRTTLDVLNAQAAVVTARTTLVNAEKNRIIAGYQLLASIGHLTAQDLGLKVVVYDPAENYDAVRNKWIGTGVETIE
jgi:outer membrane protein